MFISQLEGTQQKGQRPQGAEWAPQPSVRAQNEGRGAPQTSRIFIYIYKPPLGLTGYFAMFQYIQKCSMFYSSKNQIINEMGPDDITTCELVYIK